MATRATTLASVEELQKNFSGPMTAIEIEFVRDVQGFLEFALRNGLGFPLVLTVLSHDVNNLLRGMKIDGSGSDRFTPMVTGYANIDANAVGEPEETE